VIVAAVYRAPVLQGATQGERPQDVATPSADVAFPSVTAEPSFPADAQAGGVVMIEARLSPSGAVTTARVVKSAPPFDRPAMAAAQRWRFRPPRIGGSTESYAYLIFGFPQPVITK
jgi:TonB family protein